MLLAALVLILSILVGTVILAVFFNGGGVVKLVNATAVLAFALANTNVSYRCAPVNEREGAYTYILLAT